MKTTNNTTQLACGICTFLKQSGESPVPIPRMENAMRCGPVDREETNGNLRCQSCADMIPPFALPPPIPGTELSLALAAELAPCLAAD